MGSSNREPIGSWSKSQNPSQPSWHRICSSPGLLSASLLCSTQLSTQLDPHLATMPFSAHLSQTLDSSPIASCVVPGSFPQASLSVPQLLPLTFPPPSFQVAASSSSTPLIPGPISVPATWALYTICSWGRLPHPVGREAPYPPGLELPNFWQCIFCTPASGCLPRPDVEFSQANSSTLFVPRTRSSQLKG